MPVVTDHATAAIVAYTVPQTLTDEATIVYDASLGINAKVTLTAARTLAAITNAQAGQSGTLTVIQDGTGGWGLTKDASMEVVSGVLGDIASMGADEVAKITWETHDGVDFYLWIIV